MVDEASQRAMEAPDMSKKEGIVAMPTIVLDPPGAGGESRRCREPARKTRRGMLVLWQERPHGSAPSRRNLHPDPSGPNRETDSNRIALRAPNKPKGMGPPLVMKHKANSMGVNTSKSNEVYYVDSRASNDMTSHEEWFSYLEKPEKQGVVETGDDTPHTIEHVVEVPLSHIG